MRWTSRSPESPEREHLARLEADWDEHVGRALQMTSSGRSVGRMYEAACTHEHEGWSYSYLAATPEAAFEGLTTIAARRGDRGRSPWKRYART